MIYRCMSTQACVAADTSKTTEQIKLLQLTGADSHSRLYVTFLEHGTIRDIMGCWSKHLQ